MPSPGERIAMSAIVEPTPDAVGAEVRGIELGNLTTETAARISDALATHGLIVVRDQPLDREQHIGLALTFGALDEFDTRVPNASQTPYIARAPGTAVVTEISNVDKTGTLLPIADVREKHLGRRESWRSDGSFKEIPVKASILVALEVTPGAEGDTEFADMQRAYSDMPEAQRQHLQTLTAWHSAVYVKAAAGEIPLEAPADPVSLTGAAHGLVISLPSGSQALYIGENACQIDGMSVEESGRFLAQLRSAACRSPHVYRHQWRSGDVVIWDSRRFLHRTMQWDTSKRRRLRHISVAGEG
jgi:alpha-ketoglutarate-dependent 2,4-dichlorophenoxyacetate dioxygenase